jgi:hypothetical protein
MSQFLKLKNIVNYCHFKIFMIETFVRDVRTIQKLKIIHVFGSSYVRKTYSDGISLGSENYVNQSVYLVRYATSNAVFFQ